MIFSSLTDCVRVAAGWLTDQYHRVYLLATIFAGRALCYAAMYWVTGAIEYQI